MIGNGGAKATAIKTFACSHLPLFGTLTTSLRARKVVFFNSRTQPDLPQGFELMRYRTTTRTNWHRVRAGSGRKYAPGFPRINCENGVEAWRPLAVSPLSRQAATCFFHVAASAIPCTLHRSAGHAQDGVRAAGTPCCAARRLPTDALARELGAMGLL
jgi:hypothetical protein